MFENSTGLDFDDDILGTSFAPVFSSTQDHYAKQTALDQSENVRERQNDDVMSNYVKKFKSNESETFEERNRNDNIERNISTKVLSKISHSEILKQSNIENIKPCDNKFSSPAKVVKRRFPGPAGLLPEKNSNTKSFSDSFDNDSNDDVFLCSQQTLSSFEDGPWSEMIGDFGMPGCEALYEKYNINWIKKNCSAKKLLKAPFLAAIIQSVEIIHGNMATINILLKDTTGNIEGTILSSLYEEKAKLFTPGSVIVLKQFGVLTVSNSHCLTITPNSLLVIYHLEKDVDGNPVSVKKSVMQEFTLDNIWRQTHANETDRINLSLNLQMASNTHKLHILPPKPHESRTNYSNNTNFSSTLSRLEQNSINPVGSKESSKVSASNIVKESMKVFHFKKTSSEDNSRSGIDAEENPNHRSQITVQSDKEHAEIWKDLFEDVDPESLFGEF